MFVTAVAKPIFLNSLPIRCHQIVISNKCQFFVIIFKCLSNLRLIKGKDFCSVVFPLSGGRGESNTKQFSFPSLQFGRAVANVSARKGTFWHNFSEAQMVVLRLLFITWTPSLSSPCLAVCWYGLPVCPSTPPLLIPPAELLIIIHRTKFLSMFSSHEVIAPLKHTHRDSRLSADMVLKVCESIRCTQRGVRGRRRGVAFVSVSGENCLSGTSKINTLTATWQRVCACRRDAMELKEAPILVT